MVSFPPELSYNQQLFDAMVRHQIGLLRFTGALRNRIWSLLDETERDLRSQIADALRAPGARRLSPARVRLMNRLLEGLRATRNRAWDRVDEVLLSELRAFALAEPNFAAGVLSTTLPVELGLALPATERLRWIVENQPFDGKVLGEWAADIRRADLDRIARQVRIGMVQGEHPRRIARRVVGTVRLRGRDGVTQITRRGAEAIVRTVVNGVGAEARREFAAANAELAPQEVFIATLDHRTTAICRSLDGKTFAVGEGPVLPLHFNERSVYGPVVDGEVVGVRPIREFTRRQLVREYAAANDLGRVTSRARLPRGHRGRFDEFARRRIRELTGEAPARTTYAQFLRRQTLEFQEEVLGVTKARLFRSGQLGLDDFVDENFRELTLAELARFEADAFRAAGLDPSAFTGLAA